MINKWAYIRVGLYSGGGGGAYIWNEVSVIRSVVSTCGGLIHGGGLIFGGLIVGGLRYAEFQAKMAAMKSTY